MKLTLDREDLRPEHVNLSCSKVRYEHLTDEAQAAVRVVGRATFQEYDRSNYNVVYGPAGNGDARNARVALVAAVTRAYQVEHSVTQGEERELRQGYHRLLDEAIRVAGVDLKAETLA